MKTRQEMNDENVKMKSLYLTYVYPLKCKNSIQVRRNCQIDADLHCVQNDAACHSLYTVSRSNDNVT